MVFAYGCAPKYHGATSDELSTDRIGRPVRKGVWLSHTASSVFKSRAHLKEAIITLNQMGVNTIYPVVWTRGMTTYNSQVLKMAIGLAADPVFEGRSVLSEIFAILQETGIKMDVIPWFEYGLKVYLGISDQQVQATLAGPLEVLAPQFRFAHLMHKRGLLVRNPLNGKVTWKDTHIQANYAFLDPEKPEVGVFLRGLVGEVTATHPVAGIQLDDHFSVHHSFAAVFRHLSITDSISRLATGIGEVAKKNNAKTRQISPAGSIAFSRWQWMQDWPSFQRDGAFNELVLQAYRDNLEDFQKLVSEQSNWRFTGENKGSVGIFAGSRTEQRSTDLIVSQIGVARNRNLGVNFFHYDTLVLDHSGKVDLARVSKIKEALGKPWVCHEDLRSFCSAR
jgi:uncharacterized lipoprotein YddW (UPF0748 family)